MLVLKYVSKKNPSLLKLRTSSCAYNVISATLSSRHPHTTHDTPLREKPEYPSMGLPIPHR